MTSRKGGRGRVSPNYSDTEKELLLHIVEEMLPLGREHWLDLAARYNSLRDRRFPERDDESLRRKFKDTYSKKKETGSGVIPELIARAKEIKRSCDRRGDVLAIDDALDAPGESGYDSCDDRLNEGEDDDEGAEQEAVEDGAVGTTESFGHHEHQADENGADRVDSPSTSAASSAPSPAPVTFSRFGNVDLAALSRDAVRRERATTQSPALTTKAKRQRADQLLLDVDDEVRRDSSELTQLYAMMRADSAQRDADRLVREERAREELRLEREAAQEREERILREMQNHQTQMMMMIAAMMKSSRSDEQR